MFERQVVIKNRAGFHLRPSSNVVKLASQFSSEINIVRNNESVNAKSIMGLISLGIKYGDTVTISAEGQDEREAVEALANLIENPLELEKT